MIRHALTLACLLTPVLAQGGASFGSPGWNDLTVNALGSSVASNAAALPLDLSAATNIDVKLDGSTHDAGQPVFLIMASGASVAPGSLPFGFGQCTTMDINPANVVSAPTVGTIGSNGVFTMSVPVPANLNITFTIQAFVPFSPSNLFLSQAHAVTVGSGA